MTVWYSVLHLLVDGMCALAMFGSFLNRDRGYVYILVYNFCAFALQMPFGVVLDALAEGEKGGRRDYAFCFAAAGIIGTAVGALLHPAVLGIGNALFHVGGGVGTIREDDGKGWNGRGLGVFVAPGALGLYLGMLPGKNGSWQLWFSGAAIAGIVLLCVGVVWKVWLHRDASEGEREEKSREQRREWGQEQGRRSGNIGLEIRRQSGRGVLKAAVCCMLVVILRSYVGMAVTFPWKAGTLAGLFAVLALAGGKAAGGFAAARYGLARTTVVSLGLAACCYLFSAFMPAGLAALFFFNMTMPLTLYWLVCSMPGRQGFAFGFLTFSLFLGFLPVYFGKLPAMGGNVVGCVGSLVSLLVLAGAVREKRREKGRDA